MPEPAKTKDAAAPGFIRELGLFDSTMIVAGSMIGSGIFIVSAEIARQVGSAGWLLLAWMVTGLLTIAAALSYGELAAMMPRAGGQYVYLREAFSPLWGFLYGWTLFLVIQTGTIAAVAVGFSRFLGVLIPMISPTSWIVSPIDISDRYAISLSVQQLVAILSLVFLTLLNMHGIHWGKITQNIFTFTKTLALIALILLGIFLGRNSNALSANFADPWTPHNVVTIRPDLPHMEAITAAAGVFGLFVAFCVAQVGSLFSADAWNNITFAAGEVKNPHRNIPLSLAAGTLLVIGLYVLANMAYLWTLPLHDIQNAPDDRVATVALQAMMGPAGATIMAFAIVFCTLGCNNGLILTGARVYYAMARDGLFFRRAGCLNSRSVPAGGLVMQCIWASFLVLARTRNLDSAGRPQYGNLYSNLLSYVVFAVLIFYVLTIAGIFVLRRKCPNAERPYRAFGYPVIPILYILAASTIAIVLLIYQTATAWPGLVIVMTGVPVYFAWRKR